MRRLLLAAAIVLPPLMAHAGAPQTVTLDVTNMTCPLCPITVRKALEKAPGVTEAKIDFEKKTATVTFDSERVDPASLVKATTDAGYPSTLRP